MKANEVKNSYLSEVILTPVALRYRRAPWWVWVFSIDLFFVLMTVLIVHISGPFVRIVQHFDLAVELNLGALWSTINLIFLTLLAYECFSTTRPQQPLKKYGWLILSIILWLLAFDEIGSLHERFEGIRKLTPYIVGFAILSIGSLGILLLFKDTRRTAVMLVIMFGLFGSVVMQEYFEHLIAWPRWAQGIRNGFEEGSELVGMFVGLSGFAWIRRGQKTKSLSGIIPDFNALDHLPVVSIISLIIHGIVSVTSVNWFTRSGAGNPVLLFPVFSLTMLLLAGLRKTFNRRMKENVSGFLLAAFSAFGLLLSIYLLVPRHESSQLSASVLSMAFPIAFGILLVLGALLYQMMEPEKARTGLRWLLLPALAILISWLAPGLAIRYITAGIISWVFFYLFILQNWRAMERAETRN